VFNSRVGTSEAIRLFSSKLSDKNFKEWLGGLIEGEGCFLLAELT